MASYTPTKSVMSGNLTQTKGGTRPAPTRSGPSTVRPGVGRVYSGSWVNPAARGMKPGLTKPGGMGPGLTQGRPGGGKIPGYRPGMIPPPRSGPIFGGGPTPRPGTPPIYNPGPLPPGTGSPRPGEGRPTYGLPQLPVNRPGYPRNGRYPGRKFNPYLKGGPPGNMLAEMARRRLGG